MNQLIHFRWRSDEPAVKCLCEAVCGEIEYPSVSMVDWNDGERNARFWILQLLRDNLASGTNWLKSSRISLTYIR